MGDDLPPLVLREQHVLRELDGDPAVVRVAHRVLGRELRPGIGHVLDRTEHVGAVGEAGHLPFHTVTVGEEPSERGWISAASAASAASGTPGTSAAVVKAPWGRRLAAAALPTPAHPAWKRSGALVGLPPVGSFWAGQVSRTFSIADFSAAVTHSSYFFFTATCAATYVHR